MPQVPKNDLGVIVGSSSCPNGGYLCYFPAKGNHTFGIRYQPTAIYCTPEPGPLSVHEGEKYLPVVRDGVIHGQSRGDTSFLAKLRIQDMEQSGVEFPVEEEPTSDRVSAADFSSTVAVEDIFEQAERRRQESSAAGMDELAEELTTVQLTGDD